MLRQRSLLLFIVFVLSCGFAKDSLALKSIESTIDNRWLDRSAKIFLPHNLGAQLEARQFFPILWWNFLVLEFDNEEKGLTQASDLCGRIRTLPGTWVAKTGCRQNLDQFKPMLTDWAQDQFVRHESPAPELFAQKMNTALAKASLPEGGDLLAILRMDPLESFKELQSHVESRVKLKFPKKSGFLIDEEAQRIVIPIQFTFPSFDSAKTKEFKTLLQKDFGDHLKLIGPHSSTFENERQVTEDLGVVSTTGTVLLVLLGIAVLLSRRWKLLLIAPPVFFSTVISTLLTIQIFGSIHGLTLSFGTGIIGIAIDFGLHSVFNRNYKGIWKANAFGLYTTVAVLIVMMFSSIPLLRQIMVFATLGITSGYVILYVLDTALPKLFDVKPIAIDPKLSPMRFAAAAGLVVFSFIGMATINLSLDMSRFDFQDSKAQGLNTWLYKNIDSKPPLMHIQNVKNDESPLEFAHTQKSWADQNHVHYEGIANFIPSLPVQQHNLETWSTIANSQKALLTPLQQTIFDPFLQELKSARTRPLQARSDAEAPVYLSDFQHMNNKTSWISLWLPKTDQEADLIKAKFEDSLSLKEIVSVFPKTLFQELAWMVPVSLLITLLLLALYYKRVYPSLLCLIPFFSGLGLFTVVGLIFSYNTSFITVIGFVMVFGLSVDYGIFATDLVIGKKRSVRGVWSALSLSALMTTLGFIPLMFCKHPVLLQLGQPLVLGTIGTYIGTTWGIPGCVKYLKSFTIKEE